jgi:hypothetical protein
MTPYPHQTEIAKEAYNILAENMIVYLAMEERTGKTLTAILTCELTAVNNILVITKKNAINGWEDALNAFDHTKCYTITNYHQAKKFDPQAFELVILDEAHNYISSFPKASKLWSEVQSLTIHKPIIYISATPYAQGPQLLYHQFALSTWSPFAKFKTAYTWFKTFGIPETVYLSGRQVETYKNVKTEEVLARCKHLFISRTRQELGFEHEPEDHLHYIELGELTKEVYNIILKQKVLELNGELIQYDTTAKLRAALHMLEGGTAKTNNIRNDEGKVVQDGKPMILGNVEKINYILDTWGDTDELVIMYNYKTEFNKLQNYFKKALLLQATSYAEGVDLSHKKHLVIYSQDFSTARHSQRRARQANKKRDIPINVHYILVKDGISDQVYQTVSINKTNFVDSVFQETLL